MLLCDTCCSVEMRAEIEIDSDWPSEVNILYTWYKGIRMQNFDDRMFS